MPNLGPQGSRPNEYHLRRYYPQQDANGVWGWTHNPADADASITQDGSTGVYGPDTSTTTGGKRALRLGDGAVYLFND